MIEAWWPRIAGIHVEETGAISCVWIAHDKDADCLHLYDCCAFPRELPAVVAEKFNGLKQRNRWIPIAWEQTAEETSKKLLERGCNMLDRGKTLGKYRETLAAAEAVSWDISERMRTGRFKVSRHLKPWLEEFRTFQRQDSKVPREGFPLMAATRHAVAMLEYAKAQGGGTKINYPKMAIV